MPVSTGLIVAVAVLAAAAALGLLRQRRVGRFWVVTRTRGHAASATAGATGASLDPLLASLGVTAGTPVTLLQFSSVFCAPCRTTRLLCAHVAARVPGVRHVEVDTESHVDAARQLAIWRTPTLLIVDAQGRIRRRASGAPSRDQLLTAVAEVMPDATSGR